MVFNTIKVEGEEIFPNNQFSLKFKGKDDKGNFHPQIIFGRNGMGKSTVAQSIFEAKQEMLEEKIPKIFLRNNSQELLKQELDKEGIYVFGDGKDFAIDFSRRGVPPVIVSNDAIEQIDEEISRFERRFRDDFDSLARKGGSNANPKGTLARRLARDFNISSATFDSSRKSQFKSKGELGFLQDIKDSTFYTKICKIGLEQFEVANQSHESDDKKQGLQELINDNFSEYDEEKRETLFLLISELLRLGWLNLEETISELNDSKKENEKKKKDRESLVEGTREEAKKYLDEINRYIANIFFDEERLQFVPTDDKIYNVESRGVEIDNLSNLSTAEQNIISLCLFFIKVFEDCTKKKHITIVLDDPISSTDYDNKIGLYSFMKQSIEHLLSLKKNAKIVILSHDMEVVYNFERLFNEVGIKYKVNELINFKLFPREETKSFYTEQLEAVFDFVEEPELKKEKFMYIGNTMRRILEAYATFNYRTGPTYLMNDEFLLQKIEDREIDKYKHLLYRLWLNGDSHSEEVSKSIVNQFGSQFSDSEKINIAKRLLKFLYMLDKYHLEKHLGQKKAESISKF